MKNTQNNFIAGVFTLLGIAGFVFIILTLSGVSAFATRKSEYTVRFSLADGASGLKNGSSVRVGGQEAGRVTSVSFWPDATDAQGHAQPPQYVDVRIAVRRDITLYNDAAVLLELPLLGNVSAINIPSVGNAEKGVLLQGSEIMGRIAPPAFLQQAGYGDEQRKAVQDILTDSRQVASDLREITGAVTGKAGTTMENINAAAADIREVAAEAKARLNDWSPRIDSTLKNVESLSASAEASRKLLNEGLEKAKEFISSVQQTLDTNRPRFDSIVKNADELVTKANTEMYQRVQATLDDAQRGVRSFSAAGDAAGNLVNELSPEVKLAMANARLASDQLKLMMTEVRRNPWRLLYQPGAKELERELVYDAARNYAQAVSDLRGVSASLESLAAAMSGPNSTTLSDADRAKLAEVQSGLLDSFARYKTAEQKFLDMIVKEP
ncbi:MAG: MlaD family protein [Phycisphaerales bacterium]|nr:MlaD family protein [Phycisphaerales bacterium]